MSNEKIFDIKDKVIILTGAAGFLGSNFAEGLARNGAKIILADINENKTKLISNNLKKKFDSDCIPIKLDVSNPTSIKKMLEQSMKKYSKVDTLINNAFFYEGKKGRKTTLEKFPVNIWKKSLDVNLTGVFLTSQIVGSQMVKQKFGSIINISSIYGLVGADQRIYGKEGNRSTPVYAATKGGIINLTRFIAAYWNRTGVRVNSISFGGFENKQEKKFIKNYSNKTILGRMAKKEEGIGPIIFLSSDASSYMTGANLIVDGGWTAW